MTRHLRFLLAGVLCLLAACSSNEAEVDVAPTRRSQAQAPAAQVRRSLPGRLVYVRDKQLWIYQGSRESQIRLDWEARDPAWSPDGKYVAFVRREESYSDLYLLDMQTQKTIQITRNGSRTEPRTQNYVHQVIWAAKPTWSPEGDEVIFLSQQRPATGPDDQPAIYEFPLRLYRFQTRLAGTREPNNEDMLPLGQDGADLVSPAWSPDGRFLAYVQARRDTTARRIMLYDFSTEQAQPFPGTPEGAYDPAWSPDGNTLAFAVSEGPSTDIWTIEGTSSGTPQRLTRLGRARAPAWSPDGASLALINVGDESTDLYVVSLTRQNGRLEAGTPEQITSGAQIDATGGLSWGR